MNRIKFDYCVKKNDETIVEDSCKLFVLKKEKDTYDELKASGKDPNEDDKGKVIIYKVGNQIERIALGKLIESHDRDAMDLMEKQTNPFDEKFKLLIKFSD